MDKDRYWPADRVEVLCINFQAYPMNATPLRMLLPAVLLLLMTGRGAALDPQGLPVCNLRPYNYNVEAVVNEVKLKDATLEEAMISIRTAAAKDVSNSHFNFVVLGQVADPAKRITLDLKQVPLKIVLEEVARTFGFRLRTESSAIVLASPSSAEPINTRTYRVPPYFLSTGSAAK